MTRVNVGIMPHELCDQMLLAEIRELPRCFAYNPEPGKAPARFTLGTGHVLWCAQFHWSLASRLGLLRHEAIFRSFKLSAFASKVWLNDGRWTRGEVDYARPLLIARISERLVQMKREPRWTGRTPPAWAMRAMDRRAPKVGT